MIVFSLEIVSPEEVVDNVHNQHDKDEKNDKSAEERVIFPSAPGEKVTEKIEHIHLSLWELTPLL